MKYLFFIIWSVWLISEILLNRLLLSKGREKKDVDKNSLKVIWIVLGISLISGVISGIYLRMPVLRTIWINYAGLMLIIIGMVIRFNAIMILGKYFTVDLSVQKDQELIVKGMYKYIRHPSYTGSLISFLGFSLSFNNWISLIIIVLPVFLSFLYRIKIEEKLMSDQFGIKYLEYKKKTWRLIPMIY